MDKYIIEFSPKGISDNIECEYNMDSVFDSIKKITEKQDFFFVKLFHKPVNSKPVFVQYYHIGDFKIDKHNAIGNNKIYQLIRKSDIVLNKNLEQIYPLIKKQKTL